ncbi:MAG: M28 family peptidase [Bacteroidetes bacterium]|nr:M28 family peptidase [Bacteroidota bacterium]
MHKFAWIFSIAFFSVSLAQQFDYRESTAILCMPEFHGRGYVNGGDSIAASYIASAYKEIGIIEYPNSHFFQSFEFPVNSFPNEMEVVLGDRTLIPGVHFVVEPSSSGFTGEMNLISALISDLYDQNLNLSNWPKNTGIVVKNFGFGGDTLRKVSQYLVKLASVIPIVEVVNAKFTWSVSSTSTKNLYLLIQDSIFKDNFNKIKVNIDSEFKKSHRSQNVIGYLPSKKKNAKTIVFTAHYDHLGRMGKDTYFPGANDNASGCSMLLYLANHFKNHPSKYNFVFIAFGGEEAGLIGSRHYVQNPFFPLQDIRFLVNLDLLGSGEDGITVVNATAFPKEFELLNKINKKKNYLKNVKSRGPAANSDHHFFTVAGVPAFFIYTMGPNKNYHDVFDKYENLTFSVFENIGNLVVDFVRKVK